MGNPELDPGGPEARFTDIVPGSHSVDIDLHEARFWMGFRLCRQSGK
jgi:hypothetical protein